MTNIFLYTSKNIQDFIFIFLLSIDEVMPLEKIIIQHCFINTTIYIININIRIKIFNDYLNYLHL